MKKSSLFIYFFVIYISLFLSYSLLFPYRIANIDLSTISASLSEGLFFPIVMTVLMSLLSLPFIRQNKVKVTIYSILVFATLGLYKSGFVFWMYFFSSFKAMLPLIIVIILSLLFAFVVHRILKSPSASVRKTILTLFLIVPLFTLGTVIIKSNTSTPVSCTSLVGTEADMCNRSFAIENGNLDLCAEIGRSQPSSDGPARCMYEVLHKLYLENKLTKPTCEMLQDENMKSVCFDRLAFMESDERYCEQVKDSYEDQRIFLYQLPFGEGDARSKLLTKQGCYLNIALKEKRPELCSQVTETFYHNGCLIDAKK